LLPLGKKPGRPPTWTRRQLIDGIRRRTRTGAPWRDVPERYGPWDRAYDRFRRWQRDGTWKRIFEQLRAKTDAKGLIMWADHQVALGGRAGQIRQPPVSACRLHDYLRWRNANDRHPDMLAAQRNATPRARVRSERDIRRGGQHLTPAA
jgi:transposase